jgi:DNA repair protein RadC
VRLAFSSRTELPRERIERLGPQVLSLAEIIAILLRTGDRGKNVLDLASSLVEEFGGLQGLSRTSFREFMEIGGLGRAKAASLVAALELARRLYAEEKAAEEGDPRESFRSRLARWSANLADEPREFIVAVFTDRRGKVIEDDMISWGGLDGAVLDLKFLLRRAVRLDAQGVLLLHNHPDGSLNASVEDRLLTEHVERKLEALGMDFLGHFITAGGGLAEVRGRPTEGGRSCESW